jgi:H+/Cl- antiporter ClcA
MAYATIDVFISGNMTTNFTTTPSGSRNLYLLKIIVLTLLIGLCAGSASALFLILLDWATSWREDNKWIIALLPLGGLIIGFAYYYLGENVVKGNNLLLEEIHTPTKTIPLRMAPLVLFGTLVTHLFGGSAGREGTAVQMGGAIADAFTAKFKLTHSDRSVIIIMGISAGFASVFGTPLAGAIFAIEVMPLGQLRYKAIVPALGAAFIAHYTCLAWHVNHTHYFISLVPQLTFNGIAWSLFAGLLFGLAALLFSKTAHIFFKAFDKIKYPPLRPVTGGALIALTVLLMGTTKYIGLGIPTILDAFTTPSPSYYFIIKLVLTALTLSAGFKGGEVTPLFFIGATLGSALSLFVPLPVALLAGMGFVAVFSGATNTPLACIVMGIELFGIDGSAFIAIACFVAYMSSGSSGIYTSQIPGGPKKWLFERAKFRRR